MIVLEAGDSLGGVAGTATAVTVTATGVSVTTSTGAETFGKLYQGQLPSSATALFTVGAGLAYIVKTLVVSNPSGSPVTGVQLFVNGTVAANSVLGPITLNAGYTATLSDNGWSVTDAMGSIVGSTSLNGAAGGDLSGTYPNPTVVKINGAVVPTSAKAVASNASNQLIAATLAGTGTGLTTGPTTSVSGDVVTFTGVVGQVADSGTLLTALAPKASPTFTGSVTLPLTTAGLVTTTAGGVIGSEATATIGQGGTGTGSTLTGLVRGSASAMTAAELSGDVTTSGSNVATVVKVNGGSVPASQPILASNASNQIVAATTTGSGTTAVLATSPTFVTSATSPVIYGGSAAGSTLTLDGTSNGAPSNAYVLINPSGQGNVGIGTTGPLVKLQVNQATDASYPTFGNQQGFVFPGLAILVFMVYILA